MAEESQNDMRKELEERTADFQENLKEFYRGNEKSEEHLMDLTTQPFWQSLLLTGKRLQKRGLTLDMEIQEQPSAAEIVEPRKDGYDYTCRRTASTKIKRTYYRGGKKIAQAKTPEITVVSFLKADVKGDRAVCPNCGHEGTLSSYMDGCDACGAKFLVSDFETKISGYSQEEDSQRKNICSFKRAFATVGITAVVLALLAICAGGITFLLLAIGRNGFSAVKAAAFMMLGMGFVPTFFRSLFYMLLIFIGMIIVMEVRRKPQIQGEAKVKALIPEFSTGDFLQNLEYELRMIHMADHAEQVHFFTECNLEQQVTEYQNVVDCCICKVQFQEVKEFGGSYRISAEVKLRLAQDVGRKIRNRYEKIRLELEGRADLAAQHSKALREYKCPNCGGSVNVLNGGVCEYCNTAVDYRVFGWIITAYENMGRPEDPYAGILAGALGIYVIVLGLCLTIAAHSDNGKGALELWKSLQLSTEYLKEVQNDMIFPDEVTEGCLETAVSKTDFSVKKTYTCEDRESVKKEYHEALLENGFLEMQKYPEGFSVFKTEDPSKNMEDAEDGMFYLEIRTEDCPDGIIVAVTLLDENWEPVEE